MRKSWCILLAIVYLAFAAAVSAQTRSMLPRFPDIVIEKGLSENFSVSDCFAKASITDSDAQTSVSFKLTNVSQADQNTSLKFRVLYPVSEKNVKLSVNGKNESYDRANPRKEINLKAGETASIELSAKVSINYSKDAVRRALQREMDEKKEKAKKATFMDEFSRIFQRERFGHRFMVGNLVSKWGIFPLEFKNVNIEVIVPRTFVMVSKTPDIWQKRSDNRLTFTTTSVEGFSGTVFLPETDKEDFLKTQELLSSGRFMH